MIKTQTASYHVWAESVIQRVTDGDAGGEELIFSVVFTCHSVCRWNCCRWIRRGCGCPWNRPNLFASDFPHVRWSWLSSQCWLRWCEGGGHKHRIQDIKQPDAGNGLWKLAKGKCVYSTIQLCFLHSGTQNHAVTTDLRESAFQLRRQPACSQQWKGSISSLLASGPCHLIHPRGEKSIQKP